MNLAFVFAFFLMTSLAANAQNEVRAEIPAVNQNPRQLRGVFGLSVSNGKDLSFSESTAKNRAGDYFYGNSTYGLERALALEVGVQSIPADGWGFSSLVTYEPRIRIKNYNEKYGKGISFKGNFSDEPSLDLITIAGNFVYGLDKFYFPFGLNYTIPTYEVSDVNTETKNGVGYQVGIGMNAFEKLTLELSYQRKTFGLREILDSGTVFSRGNGALSGLGLQARMLY